MLCIQPTPLGGYTLFTELCSRLLQTYRRMITLLSVHLIRLHPQTVESHWTSIPEHDYQQIEHLNATVSQTGVWSWGGRRQKMQNFHRTSHCTKWDAALNLSNVRIIYPLSGILLRSVTSLRYMTVIPNRGSAVPWGTANTS